MGILDQILGAGAAVARPQASQRGGLTSKLAAGVLLALAVKALRDRSNAAEGSSNAQAHGAPSAAGGGILGGLGGLLGGGGGGLGGILGNLGGAGALGGLIGALQQKGLHQEANSWVSAGANHAVAPQQLAEALGDETIQELQDKTGLPRDQLLADLAKELPEAVDAATPDGRLPETDDELGRAAGH